MNEYISREAAKEALYKTSEEYDEYDKCDRIAIVALNNADEMLNDIPAADVVEVRHGQWNGGATGWECSVCSIESNNTYPYCPYCGAVMDGGQDDD